MRSPVEVPDVIIRCTGVTVRYRDRIALDAVDLTVASGRSVALVGPNGSGKTTLLHVIAGLVDPDEGHAEVAGKVAYVLQHPGSGRWMPLTVREVLAMGRFGRLGLVRRAGPADRDAVGAAAERLAVSDLADRQFGELSGGQRQRVLVAQALAQQTDVLLMDEPITGLDMESQEHILEVIEQETASGTTVVLSTHHLDEAHHCDDVLLLRSRVVAAGPPASVLRPDVLRRAYDPVAADAHAGHDHPRGVLLVDEHAHGRDDAHLDPDRQGSP